MPTISTVANWSLNGDGAAITGTSSSFTPSDNSILILCIATEIAGTGPITATVTTSGLTWTLVGWRDPSFPSAGQNYIAIYKAEVGTGSSITVDVSLTDTLTGNTGGCQIYEVLNYNANNLITNGPSGGQGSSTNNILTFSVSSQYSGSLMICVACDSNSRGAGTSSDVTLDGFASSVSSWDFGQTTYTSNGIKTTNIDPPGGAGCDWNWLAILMATGTGPAGGGGVTSSFIFSARTNNVDTANITRSSNLNIQSRTNSIFAPSLAKSSNFIFDSASDLVGHPNRIIAGELSLNQVSDLNMSGVNAVGAVVTLVSISDMSQNAAALKSTTIGFGGSSDSDMVGGKSIAGQIDFDSMSDLISAQSVDYGSAIYFDGVSNASNTANVDRSSSVLMGFESFLIIDPVASLVSSFIISFVSDTLALGGLDVAGNINLESDTNITNTATADKTSNIDMSAESYKSLVSSILRTTSILTPATTDLFMQPQGNVAITSNFGLESNTDLTITAANTATSNINFQSNSDTSILASIDSVGSITLGASSDIYEAARLALATSFSMLGISDVTSSSNVDRTTSILVPATTDLYMNTQSVSAITSSFEIAALVDLMVSAQVDRTSALSLGGNSALNSAGGLVGYGAFLFDSSSSTYHIGGLSQHGSMLFVNGNDISAIGNKALGGIFTFTSNTDASQIAAVDRTTSFSNFGLSDMYMNPLGTALEIGQFNLEALSDLAISANVAQLSSLNLGSTSNGMFDGQRALGGIFSLGAGSSSYSLGNVLYSFSFTMAGESYTYFAVSTETIDNIVQVIGITLPTRLVFSAEIVLQSVDARGLQITETVSVSATTDL